MVALLSVLLVGVVLNSVLHGSENAPALNPIAEAAARVERCPGFNFNLYVVYGSPALPSPISAQGRGAYNSDTKRTLVTLSLDSPVTGPAKFVEVSDDTHTYQKSNTFNAELPPGKEWVRTKKDERKEDAGLDFDEAMRMLSDSGDVRVVGRQSVNGKMTRHYRANITLAKLIELLREKGKDDVADAYESLEGVAPVGISTEAWVDSKNLVRRMRFVMPTPGKNGATPMTMDMRMELFNFGSHPDIQLPNYNTIVDGPLDSSAVTQQRPPADAAASRRTFETRPTGEWVATGHVLTAKRVPNRSVGEVLHRRWRFETRCTDGACQTYFLRTSSTGAQSSSLRLLPHNYLAEFGNLGTTCEARSGDFKSFSVTFSIWWTKHRSQLVAEEMGGFNGGPRCRYAGERIRWTAHRRSGNHSVLAHS